MKYEIWTDTDDKTAIDADDWPTAVQAWVDDLGIQLGTIPILEEVPPTRGELLEYERKLEEYHDAKRRRTAVTPPKPVKPPPTKQVVGQRPARIEKFRSGWEDTETNIMWIDLESSDEVIRVYLQAQGE